MGFVDIIVWFRNPGPGYDTLLLRLIPGDLLSAFPHRQFHTLPGLLDSRAALSNSYPNALRAIQGGSLYHFHDGLWYDPAGRRTHDLPCERRTRLPLSQPDTVIILYSSATLECHAEGTTHDNQHRHNIQTQGQPVIVFWYGKPQGKLQLSILLMSWIWSK